MDAATRDTRRVTYHCFPDGYLRAAFYSRDGKCFAALTAATADEYARFRAHTDRPPGDPAPPHPYFRD